MKNKTIIISLFLFLIVVAGGFWIWSTQAEASSDSEVLEANGIIEARQALLASEVGGLAVEVLVEEGQRIKAGQTLVRIDDSLLETQRQQAHAALQAAEAQLALLESGTRPEQIAAAEAKLASLEANLRMAQSNLALLEAGATEEQIAAAKSQMAQAAATLRLTQATLDTLTVRTPPETIATTKISLDHAWDRYNNLQVSFTTDQIEEIRSALTKAEDTLAAAEARRDDIVAEDTRHPEYVITAFDTAVEDTRIAVAATQRAYDAAKDDTLVYVDQIELARLSWQTLQMIEARIQAQYDGLNDDKRTTTDTLDKYEDILDDIQDLVTEAENAYKELTSGRSGIILDTAWDEVQRLQAQLGGYALAKPTAAGTIPSVESLLAQIDSAKAQFDIANANLAALEHGARDEEIEATQAQVDAATAQRDTAVANLAGLVNGARAEEIAAAQSQVDAAQSQLDAIDVQLARFTILAPFDGIVLARSVEPGETAFPGTTLLEIGRLDRLELTVYVAEDRFGLVTPGQTAQVSVDTYPGQIFTGTVLRLSNEAEFTPINIQTEDDRVRLVYAVVISLDNPDLKLKPGMIADVTFAE